MNCPKCGYTCQLVCVDFDQYGAVREWQCFNDYCLWREGDEIEDDAED